MNEVEYDESYLLEGWRLVPVGCQIQADNPLIPLQKTQSSCLFALSNNYYDVTCTYTVTAITDTVNREILLNKKYHLGFMCIKIYSW